LDLSIIIVNYNVKHYLAQCLRSVFIALEGIDGEVIVVDNNSTDGSQEFIEEKFGDRLLFIANKDNPGFSKANNQGMRIAKGRYVLLLNPDTVVEAHTFRACIDFMDAHPDGGALGVQMIDGQGIFLPESKRALPTPWVSFYKIFGLAALFPKSKKFGQYHLTYLDKDENHEIEILSGAFMFMRKSVLDEIGLLDETFFMYGEDIDLSYRVLLGGYKNYYFSDTRIIHYKGESTKKGSLNYVRVFYQAMIIFARKHFGGARKQLFIASIQLAVYFRALLAVGYRVVQRLGFPLTEGALFFAAGFGITAYWEYYVKYIKYGVYPDLFRYGHLPAYALIFVLWLWMLGGYKKPFRLRPLILGPFLGYVSIATATYMVSFIENYSRAISGLMAVFSMLIALGTRMLIHSRERGSFFFTEEKKRRILLVGKPEGFSALAERIRHTYPEPVEIIGGAIANDQGSEKPVKGFSVLGSAAEMEAILQHYDVDELVFANEDMPSDQIFSLMVQLSDRPLRFKIAPPGEDFLIGTQEVLLPQTQRIGPFRLAQSSTLRNKRVFDQLAGGVLFLSWPLIWWRYKRPLKALRGIWQVLRGQKHLVSYQHPQPELPNLNVGLLNPAHRSRLTLSADPEVLDAYYARAYSWQLDFEILWKAWRLIGTEVS